MFQGTLDDDLADLLGIDNSEPAADPQQATFSELFKDEISPESATRETVNLKIESFHAPERFFEDKPDPVFTANDYYRTVLDNEGQEAERFHRVLNSFVKTTDPQERSLYRAQLISAYAALQTRFAAQICTDLPKPKRFAFRYGLVTPALIDSDTRTLFASIIQHRTTDEPIFYNDEWLQKVATGAINPSATDETKQIKAQKDTRSQSQLLSMQANLASNKDFIKIKAQNVQSAEHTLKELIQSLTQHAPNARFPDLTDCYSPMQKNIFTEIANTLTALRNLDRDLETTYNDLNRQQDKYEQLKQSLGESVSDATSVDNEALSAEFGSVRQMTKLCTGRQGNHIPILMKPYIHNDRQNIATRERVLQVLKEIEEVDCELFLRTHRRETYRIVPYFILVPSYGDAGICWEPFERYNRATSRGRIAIPMYPKNLKTAVVTALADFRWQVAKEKAAHYWMEEGVTGGYFQYYTDMKLKGNIKDFFIQDYVTWVLKESEGMQKLPKEVRTVFWRHMPFSQPVKEKLKFRGTTYSELYKRDQNRAMSDGY